jgi:thiamine biosynthesis protein ThiI
LAGAATPAAFDGVLVRFGEIGIKSPQVRSQMLERLRRNLLSQMEHAGVEGNVERRGARLWMAGPDVTRLAETAARTFGVVSASPVVSVPSTLEAMSAAAVPLALARPWKSFAVRARREGSHAFSSQDIGVRLGSDIFLAAQAAGRPGRVDLTNPEFTLDVDVRAGEAYLFTDTLAGPGGLPIGSQGRVVALLSDEASMVAAWLVMRRGCEVFPMHAGDGGPIQPWLVALANWGLARSATIVPASGKAAMFAAAAQVAREHDATAIVTGETLDSRFVEAPMPVLRPVCGLDAREYARCRDRIGLPTAVPKVGRHEP